MKSHLNKSGAAAVALPSTRPAAPARRVRGSTALASAARGAPRLAAVAPVRNEVRGGRSASAVRPTARATGRTAPAPNPASAAAPTATARTNAPTVVPAPALRGGGRAAHEPRTTPSTSASSVSPHGSGDATLARYMSELANHELLGRDEEIALAQEVERLEIAYWRALLSFPRAVPALRSAIETKLEEPPAELPQLLRAASAVRSSSASKSTRTRYERAVERMSVKLRELDLHRDAVKQTHENAIQFADSNEGLRGARAGTRSKAVQHYLDDAEAARRAQQRAKDRFVAANLRLVVSMARRYAREGRMPLADLIQEGNLGLMKAVERFDHRRGFRFSTYASWWIRHALTRGLADKGRLVRLPVHALETRARLTRAARKIMCKTGVAPSLAELAAETGLAPDKLTAVEEFSTEAPFSLDAPVGADNDRTFLDMLRYEDQSSAEDGVLSESHKQSLATLLDELSPFEAQILRYRYGFEGGEERTLKEIGQMYNLSRERIRQIQAAALAKMRARAEASDQERAAL